MLGKLREIHVSREWPLFVSYLRLGILQKRDAHRRGKKRDAHQRAIEAYQFIWGELWAIHVSQRWPLFRYLITAENSPNVG